VVLRALALERDGAAGFLGMGRMLSVWLEIDYAGGRVEMRDKDGAPVQLVLCFPGGKGELLV
jgi:hypothetical protein